jgi:hypothetical protein
MVVLGTDYKDARALTAALVDKLESSLAGGELELPSLPEVALKIRSALADDNVSVVARLLGFDPALAARTLRVADRCAISSVPCDGSCRRRRRAALDDRFRHLSRLRTAPSGRRSLPYPSRRRRPYTNSPWGIAWPL